MGVGVGIGHVLINVFANVGGLLILSHPDDLLWESSAVVVLKD